MCYIVHYYCKDCGEYQNTNENRHCGLHKARGDLIARYGAENLCWGHTGEEHDNKVEDICKDCRAKRKQRHEVEMELFGYDSEEDREIEQEEREMEIKGGWVSRLGKEDRVEDVRRKDRENGLYPATDSYGKTKDSGSSAAGASGSGSRPARASGSGSRPAAPWFSGNAPSEGPDPASLPGRGTFRPCSPSGRPLRPWEPRALEQRIPEIDEERAWARFRAKFGQNVGRKS